MSRGTVKIELTEEQQRWLLQFLNREWNEEVEYQWRNQESETDYLKDMLDVYEALLGKTDSWIIAYSINEDIESKKKQIKELEESNDEVL